MAKKQTRRTRAPAKLPHADFEPWPPSPDFTEIGGQEFRDSYVRNTRMALLVMQKTPADIAAMYTDGDASAVAAVLDGLADETKRLDGMLTMLRAAESRMLLVGAEQIERDQPRAR